MKKETMLKIFILGVGLGLIANAVMSGWTAAELIRQNQLLREQNAIYREALRCREVSTTPTAAEVWCGKPIE